MRFFFLVSGVGTGNTVFGALPVDPEPLENLAHGFPRHHFGGEPELEADLGQPLLGPQAGLEAEVARTAMDEGT